MDASKNKGLPQIYKDQFINDLVKNTQELKREFVK